MCLARWRLSGEAMATVCLHRSRRLERSADNVSARTRSKFRGPERDPRAIATDDDCAMQVSPVLDARELARLGRQLARQTAPVSFMQPGDEIWELETSY